MSEIGIFPSCYYSFNINNSKNINYVITVHKYEIICNTAYQYYIYKSNFQLRTNLVKNIIENINNINEKIFYPFVDQLKKILSIFNDLFLPEDFLENKENYYNYKLNFHLVFKEIITDYNIITCLCFPKLNISQYVKKISIIQKEELNIKLLFNDIFDYVIYNKFKIYYKPILNLSFIHKRIGVEENDDEIVKRIL